MIKLIVPVIVLSFFTLSAFAADARIGRDISDQICMDCHDVGSGEMTEFYEVDADKLKAITAGKIKHKPKLSYTDSQAEDLAAYFATIK